MDLFGLPVPGPTRTTSSGLSTRTGSGPGTTRIGSGPTHPSSGADTLEAGGTRVRTTFRGTPVRRRSASGIPLLGIAPMPGLGGRRQDSISPSLLDGPPGPSGGDTGRCGTGPSGTSPYGTGPRPPLCEWSVPPCAPARFSRAGRRSLGLLRRFPGTRSHRRRRLRRVAPFLGPSRPGPSPPAMGHRPPPRRGRRPDGPRKRGLAVGEPRLQRARRPRPPLGALLPEVGKRFLVGGAALRIDPSKLGNPPWNGARLRPDARRRSAGRILPPGGARCLRSGRIRSLPSTGSAFGAARLGSDPWTDGERVSAAPLEPSLKLGNARPQGPARVRR